MLHIFDENLCPVPRFKGIVKAFLGLRNRGPRAVFNSLIRGLQTLNVPFVVNKKGGDALCVLSGVCALREVLKWKRDGLVKKIVAGPNIVVFPNDANGLICDPAVDIILVPAQWVKELWISLRPELAPRIVVWAAGVQDPGVTVSRKRKGFLIYRKRIPTELFDFIIRTLDSRRIEYIIMEYGSFSQDEYFTNLNQVKGVLYLTESESQGLALTEAWIRDVPTLVWDRGLFQGGGYTWEGASSAPYLTPLCGMRFTGEKDFLDRLDDFLNDIELFQSRKYALEYFTDKKSTESFLKIISL